MPKRQPRRRSSSTSNAAPRRPALQESAAPRLGGCPRCLAEGEYPVPELTEGRPREGAYPELDVILCAFHLLERGDHQQMLALFADDFAGRTISTGELVQGRAGASDFLDRANEGQSGLEPAVSRYERNGQGQV